MKTELFNRGPGEKSAWKNILSFTLFVTLGLVFREAERELSYALVIGNPMVLPLIRSILMALQAHILRVLLYDTLPVRVYYRPKYVNLSVNENEMLVKRLQPVATDFHDAT